MQYPDINVLIVEDDHDDLQSVSAVLDDHGLTRITNLKTSIEFDRWHKAGNRAHLYVLDYHLRPITFDEVLRTLQNAGINPDDQVIAISNERPDNPPANFISKTTDIRTLMKELTLVVQMLLQRIRPYLRAERP